MKDNFNQFIDDLAKASGQYALCEAVKKGYKACCEARHYYMDTYLKSKDPDGKEFEYTFPDSPWDKKGFMNIVRNAQQYSTNKEPYKFGKPRIFSAMKDVDGEGYMIQTPRYVDDDEIIPDTGKHEDSIANIRKIMDYAEKLANDKYGLDLIKREVKSGNPDYPYISYELEGSSRDSSLEDGPDGTYDNYVKLANDLSKLGFDYRTFHDGDYTMSWTTHRYTYTGRYR